MPNTSVNTVIVFWLLCLHLEFYIDLCKEEWTSPFHSQIENCCNTILGLKLLYDWYFRSKIQRFSIYLSTGVAATLRRWPLQKEALFASFAKKQKDFLFEMAYGEQDCSTHTIFNIFIQRVFNLISQDMKPDVMRNSRKLMVWCHLLIGIIFK